MTEEVGQSSRRLAAENDYLLIGISECTLSDRWGERILKPHQATSQQTVWKTWGFEALKCARRGILLFCILNRTPDVRVD